MLSHCCKGRERRARPSPTRVARVTLTRSQRSSQDGASRGGSIRSRGTRGGRGESTAGFVWAACARFAGNRKAGFRRARRHSRLIRCRRAGKSIAFDSVGRRAPEGGAEAGPSGGLGAPKRAISGDRSGTGSARTLYASACNSLHSHLPKKLRELNGFFQGALAHTTCTP